MITDLSGCKCVKQSIPPFEAKFDLAVTVEERVSDYLITADFDAELYNSSRVKQWLTAFISLLEDITNNLAGVTSQLSTASRQQEIIQVEPEEVTEHVCSRFEQMLTLYADKPALVGFTTKTTYGELNAEANKLAAVLLAKGCLLYTSPSPRDATLSRMPSSA